MNSITKGDLAKWAFFALYGFGSGMAAYRGFIWVLGALTLLALFFVPHWIGKAGVVLMSVACGVGVYVVSHRLDAAIITTLIVLSSMALFRAWTIRLWWNQRAPSGPKFREDDTSHSTIAR